MTIPMTMRMMVPMTMIFIKINKVRFCSVVASRQKRLNFKTNFVRFVFDFVIKLKSIRIV